MLQDLTIKKDGVTIAVAKVDIAGTTGNVKQKQVCIQGISYIDAATVPQATNEEIAAMKADQDLVEKNASLKNQLFGKLVTSFQLLDMTVVLGGVTYS
jgi:hypothetical protein